MPPQGNQCPFCQLISNPEQLKIVGETENFYAWLDINPRAKGYTMIVPKEHKDSIEQFSPGEYHEAMTLVRKVVEKAKKGLGADGVSVTMNIDEAAGQMVPHAYIQVFPRFDDEESSGTPTGAIFQPHEEAKKNLDSIKEKMASVESEFGESTKEAHPDSQKFREEKKSSGKSESEKSTGEEKKEEEDEAIDKIADQFEGSSPLSLASGKSGKSRKSGKSERKTHETETAETEEDEVELGEEFEAKSFEWD